MATTTVARPIQPARSLPQPAQGDVIPDARELHRVITASVRELLETARLEAQAGPMDVAEIERHKRDDGRRRPHLDHALRKSHHVEAPPGSRAAAAEPRMIQPERK